jgi:prepilin-type processing-associated H-X9-DG protein
MGGWSLPHRSPHFNGGPTPGENFPDMGKEPAGGNVLFMDGHVAWRQFGLMQMFTPGYYPEHWM